MNVCRCPVWFWSLNTRWKASTEQVLASSSSTYLGEALVNYVIPDTYAVRYQPPDIAHKAKRPLASDAIR